MPPVQWLARAVTTVASEVIMVLGIVHYSRVPFLVRATEMICRAHLRRQVPDRRLRRALTPRYGFGCKRPSFSNRYFPTFMRDDVELVTDRIERITEHAIVTRDGREREIDTLVLATGFKTLEIGAMLKRSRSSAWAALSWGLLGRASISDLRGCRPRPLPPISGS